MAIRSASGLDSAGRRSEFQRLLERIQVENGWTRKQAVLAVSNRFSTAVNTVEGWCSMPRDGDESQESKRSPPDWKVIEILRFEFGEAQPTQLKPFKPQLKVARTKPAGGAQAAGPALRKASPRGG